MIIILSKQKWAIHMKNMKILKRAVEHENGSRQTDEDTNELSCYVSGQRERERGKEIPCNAQNV